MSLSKKNLNLLQVTKWIFNSGTNNGILTVTASPSDTWPESNTQVDRQSNEKNAYLVIHSDDRREDTQHPNFYNGKIRLFSPGVMLHLFN